MSKAFLLPYQQLQTMRIPCESVEKAQYYATQLRPEVIKYSIYQENETWYLEYTGWKDLEP